MTNTRDKINMLLDTAEERVSKLEENLEEIMQNVPQGNRENIIERLIHERETLKQDALCKETMFHSRQRKNL